MRNFHAKNEMFYSWGERGFILTNKLQKEQTGTSANSLAGQSIRGPFLSPAKRLVSTDRILTIDLAQSRKPAAVGMFAYSGSANICFHKIGPNSHKDNFKQLLANYRHAFTANYSIRVQEKYPRRGEKNLCSIFRAGVIMTFSKKKK